jgi:hypothetical protein
VDELFEEMAAAGKEMAQEDVLASEMAITFAELEDPTNIALALIDDAIGTYESLVPKTRHDEVPKAVERRSIAKAAFLRLAVEDLEAQVQEEGIEGDLRGRYIETKTASFFIFGDVTRSGNTLRARGRVRSFTVNTAEAGGRAQLNFKPFCGVAHERNDAPGVLDDEDATASLTGR